MNSQEFHQDYIGTSCAAERKACKGLTARGHSNLRAMNQSWSSSGQLSKQATLEQAAKSAYSLLVLAVAKNRLVDGTRADVAC